MHDEFLRELNTNKFFSSLSFFLFFNQFLSQKNYPGSINWLKFIKIFIQKEVDIISRRMTMIENVSKRTRIKLVISRNKTIIRFKFV